MVNIDQLQAGQELDVMVVTGVMGWRKSSVDGVWIGADEQFYGIDERMSKSRRVNPSLFENDAGLIIDHLVAQGYLITVYTGQYRDQGIKSRCCILHTRDVLNAYGAADAIANTRPLAICRAALKTRERRGE